MHCLDIKIRPRLKSTYPVEIVYYFQGKESTPHYSNTVFHFITGCHQELACLIDDPYAYGHSLGRRFFNKPITRIFNQALASSQCPLKIRLSIEARELQALSWEYLCAPIDSDNQWSFLALDQRIVMTYGVNTERSPYPFIEKGALNALLLLANPEENNGYNLSRFDENKAYHQVKQGLGEVSVAVLGNDIRGFGVATLLNLEKSLSDQEFNILHIMAHGQYLRDEFFIYLLDEQGKVKPYKASTIIAHLKRIAQLPAFIFLAVCYSGQRQPMTSSFAQQLIIELGSVYVISMSERLLITDAYDISVRFYRQLMMNGQVDVALNKAIVGLSVQAQCFVPIVYTRQLWGSLFLPDEVKKARYLEVNHLAILAVFCCVLIMLMLTIYFKGVSNDSSDNENQIIFLSSGKITLNAQLSMDEWARFFEVKEKITDDLKQNPDSSNFLFKSAFNALSKEGQVDQALDLFKLVQNESPSEEFNVKLAELAFLLFEFERSNYFYQKAGMASDQNYLFEMGINYFQLGQYNKASQLFYQALENNTSSASHHGTVENKISLYRYLGLNEQRQGNLSKALQYFNDAKALDEQFNTGTLSLARTINNIGLVYDALAQYALAKDKFKQTIELTANDQYKARYFLGTFWNNLASSDHALGDLASAINGYQKALEYDQQILGGQHPNIARTLNNLVDIYLKNKDYPSAIHALSKAMNIDLGVYGKRHPIMATRFISAGSVFLEFDMHQEALSCYENALMIYQEIFGTTHYQTALAYLSLGTVYYRKGNITQSLHFFSQAHNLLSTTLGNDHEYTRLSREYLESAQQDKTSGQRTVTRSSPLTTQLKSIECVL